MKKMVSVCVAAFAALIVGGTAQAATPVWENLYTAGNHINVATATVADSSGNVYVAGYGVSTLGANQFSVLEYNASNTIANSWPIQVGSGDNLATNITVDAHGNIYVVGQIQVIGRYATYELQVAKINPTTGVSWVEQWTANSSNIDTARAVTVDASGNVYVVGDDKPTSGAINSIVLEYNSSGTLVNHTVGTGLGSATKVALDASGNVYVAGAAITKYNSSLTQQWTNSTTYICAGGGGSTSSVNTASSLFVDSAGNPWVAGYKIYKVDPTTGAITWSSQVFDPVGTGHAPTSIAQDTSGNVYAVAVGTVNLSPSGTASALVTVKYNSSGTLLWSQAYYNTAGNISQTGLNTSGGYEFGCCYNFLSVDTLGNVFSYGTYKPSSSNPQTLIVKYTSAGTGTFQWANAYTYNGQGELLGGIAANNSGGVFGLDTTTVTSSGPYLMTFMYN